MILTITATDTTITAEITDAAGFQIDGNVWTEDATAEFDSDAAALTDVAEWVRSEGWTIGGPVAFDIPVQVSR